MRGKPRLGISACLLGQRTRYDGRHKRDRLLAKTLGQHVEYIPVCPEVECGLSVPREPMRLVGNAARPRLVTGNTGVDHTRRMRAWARRRVKELAGERLCGFILKSKSPSCGMDGVTVFDGRGEPSGHAPGLFARILMKRFPRLPVEDEARLRDPAIRESFLKRVLTLARSRRGAPRHIRSSFGKLKPRALLKTLAEDRAKERER